MRRALPFSARLNIMTKISILTAFLTGTASLLAAATPSEVIVREARESIGVRYRWARSDAKATDCAGLVHRVARSAGVELPRSSVQQYAHGTPVGRDELHPGDLVFFKNTYKRGISHVGIYIGEGEFIHAASRRRSVMISRLDQPYFARRFAGARRVAIDPVPEPAQELIVGACEVDATLTPDSL